MGEPVSISSENRAKTRSLAAAIVESVTNDERMPLDLDTVYRNDGRGVLVRMRDVESLVMQLAQEICALADASTKAAERLLFAMHIYRGYKIESRGPAGCMFDALEAVRPDLAEELRDEIDASQVYAAHFKDGAESE